MSDAHALEPDYGTGKKKFSVYAVGIILCVILTLIPFTVVMQHLLTRSETLVVIFASGTLQFLVQVVCFLRLNYITEQSKMNVMSLIFTVVILGAIVVGSLWIMDHLHYNMMH